MSQNSTLPQIDLVAESLIETDLQFTPNKVNLPTLISVEQILEQINDRGLEVVSFEESEKIASLIANYYLPILKSNWQNKAITLNVKPLSLNNEQYQDVRKVRNSVINAAKQINYHQSQNNNAMVKRTQDDMANAIIQTVKRQPSWWDKNKGEIFKYALNTTLNVIINSVLGIPLGSLVTGALNTWFNRS
jgi:hypothetical protein